MSAKRPVHRARARRVGAVVPEGERRAAASAERTARRSAAGDPDAALRTKAVLIRLTPEEKQTLVAVARDAAMGMSTLLRHLLVRRAQEQQLAPPKNERAPSKSARGRNP